MKTHSKRCQTLKQAESEQNKLYDLYDSVKLICCPLFGETGVYVWQVC